jgi:hypothetical protein
VDEFEGLVFKTDGMGCGGDGGFPRPGPDHGFRGQAGGQDRGRVELLTGLRRVAVQSRARVGQRGRSWEATRRIRRGAAEALEFFRQGLAGTGRGSAEGGHAERHAGRGNECKTSAFSHFDYLPYPAPAPIRATPDAQRPTMPISSLLPRRGLLPSPPDWRNGFPPNQARVCHRRLRGPRRESEPERGRVALSGSVRVPLTSIGRRWAQLRLFQRMAIIESAIPSPTVGFFPQPIRS